MRRFIQFSELKPEKADEYIRLHAEPWPELLELISSCNIHHYSISIPISSIQARIMTRIWRGWMLAP